jgi:Leucine-rich repeat (LRR) protein
MRGKNILKFAPKVENLDLSNNGMQTIPFDYFKNLQHLVNLNLSENSLTSISFPLLVQTSEYFSLSS